MADDDADDSTQSDSHIEDDDATGHRWQFELDEMTPEERERTLAAFRANVGRLQAAAWKNNAWVKAHMGSLFDLQRREEQSLFASFVPKLQPFIPPVVGTWAQQLPAGG